MEVEYNYMEKFLEEISKLESFPSYLDSAMLEHIVDVAATSEGSLNAVLKWGFTHTKKPTKFARTFCLKVARKCLESDTSITDYQDGITKFLLDSLHFATLKDFSLINAIFLLLNAMKVENIDESLKKDAWDLAVRCLKDGEVSLFAKKAACSYCKVLIDRDRSSLDMESLISSLCSSEDDFKCVAEIFLRCPDAIDEHIAGEVCSNALTTRTFNYAYIKLLATLFEKYSDLRTLFTARNWHSERMKLSILRDMVSSGCKDMVPYLLSGKTITLADILPCFTFMPEQERNDLLKQWMQKLNDRRKCAAEDVLVLLQLPWLTDAHFDSIFEALKERIWNSPEFLKMMIQENAEWCKKRQLDILNCAMEGIRSPDWEKRDAAVEIARILWEALHPNVDCFVEKLKPLCCDDANPFVRANSLRFLSEVDVKDVTEIAKKLYWTETFSEPRLEAISVLDKKISASEQWCVQLFEAAIDDPDFEIQEKALSIASKLLKLGGQNVKAVRDCLEKHVKDGSIWRNEISLILGNNTAIKNDKRNDSSSSAFDLLKEALEKLRFPPDKEDQQQMTMDCY